MVRKWIIGDKACFVGVSGALSYSLGVRVGRIRHESLVTKVHLDLMMKTIYKWLTKLIIATDCRNYSF